MAQTTAGISFKDNKLELSTDGVTWTDISGYSNLITPDGGERAVEEFFTFDGDTPIVGKGKRSMLELKVKIVYTEGASDPQEVMRAAYENDTDVYLRWSPKGGQTGEFTYTTNPCVVTSNPYPGGEASSAETTVVEYTLATAKITKGTAS